MYTDVYKTVFLKHLKPRSLELFEIKPDVIRGFAINLSNFNFYSDERAAKHNTSEHIRVKVLKRSLPRNNTKTLEGSGANFEIFNRNWDNSERALYHLRDI